MACGEPADVYMWHFMVTLKYELRDPDGHASARRPCPVPRAAVGEVQARRRAAQSDRAAAPARPHTGRKPVSPDLMICGVPVRVWERVRVRVRARVRVGVRVVDRMS